MADMGKSYMLFNGSCTVLYMPKSSYGDKVLVDDTVNVDCGTYHRARVVMGALGTNDFYLTAWESYYETLAEEEISGSEYADDITAGSNFVWWSSIGGGDVLWPYNKDLAMTGTIRDGWHTEADNAPITRS